VFLQNLVSYAEFHPQQSQTAASTLARPLLHEEIMGNGIPPAESRPRHQEWVQASIRYLKAKQRLEALRRNDPAYVDAVSECRKAKEAYEIILGQLI
jgi:hypothetical protein